MHVYLALSFVLFTSTIHGLPLSRPFSLVPRIGGTGAGSTGAAGTMGMYAGFTPPYIPTASTSPSVTADSMPSFIPTAAAAASPTGGSNDLVPRLIDAVARHLYERNLEDRALPSGSDGQRGADGPNGVTYSVASTPSPPPVVQQVPPVAASLPLEGPTKSASSGGHVGPIGSTPSVGFIQEA
ncbi:MAG: hypothetical protein M1814_002558 [Vezdaea aestivalis]|nr:MAG: hypothetical protein M1814_002558 [Vezdaea aestivalis]